MFTDILLLAILIGVNAFFAAAEIALISVNSNQVRIRAEQGDRRYVILQRMLHDPSNFLATIQICITLAGFLASAFAADNFADPITQRIMSLGLPLAQNVVRTIVLVLVTMILSYFTLVLGELVPKQVALKRADAVASFVVNPLRFFSKIAAPFVFILTKSTNVIARLFGVRAGAREQSVTEEEILHMVDTGNENGLIEQSQKDMIGNIFELSELTAEEVMVHRTDIVAIGSTAKVDEVVRIAVDEGFSRIPVYEDSIDDIVGIIHVKDLFCLVGCAKTDDCPLSDFIRDVIYVPESGRVMDVFRELTAKKMHMAIVVDEYGGTAGLITMENIIEEVMGNIQDEYDDESEEISQITDDTYIIMGTADPEAVLEQLGGNLPQDHDYDTIGGLIIDLIGHIPTVDEKPTVRFGDIEFAVLLVQDRRIEKIKAIVQKEDHG